MGKLIVLEGACDGIGKSTQFYLLGDFLISNGINPVKHHFPTYESYHGVPVLKYLSGEFGKAQDLSPYFINGLYAMDRACAWHGDLKQKYENGEYILLDRYTTSSIIYQSALIEDIEERKKFIDYITDFEYNRLEIKKPDEVIFLHAPFDLVTELRKARKVNDGIMNDIHESDLEFMKKVYDNAMFVSEYLSWNMIQCNEGNRMRSIDDIHNDVKKLVLKKIK